MTLEEAKIKRDQLATKYKMAQQELHNHNVYMNKIFGYELGLEFYSRLYKGKIPSRILAGLNKKFNKVTKSVTVS